LLVIRLARTGRAKYPTYRIVAAESARAATGKFVAVLGHYNPHTKELVIKQEEVQKHLSHGAQPSNTVVKLLMREKLELPGWVKLKTKTPAKAETPGTAETPDTEVSDSEAAADAGTSDSPALTNSDERVAETTEEVVSDTVLPDADKQETAASDENLS
jgi:small subunit ribosomal protein S16